VPELQIAAEPRTEFGKGAARRVRRAHKVPGVVYGHGTDPRHVTLPGHDLMKALKTANVLLDLEVDGDHLLVLPKSVQRDPIKGTLEHVDLVIVRRGEKVTVDVGIHVSGEVGPGGMLDQQMISLSVEAEATSIPTRFHVDVEGKEIGYSVHARDVELPEGTTLVTDEDALVLHVLPAPTAEQIDAELAEAEIEAGIEHDLPDAEIAAAEAEAGEAAADTTGTGDSDTNA
jgi:large subunit ribosomal protein L25